MKKVISILLLSAIYSSGATLDQFFNALGKVESSHNPKAIGDNGKSIGIYQIQKSYFLDAQEFDKSLKQYRWEDCFNTNISRRVVLAYFQRWEKTAYLSQDWSCLAYCHNGGPNHRKKTGQARLNLQNYWKKVDAAMKIK